MERVKCIQFDGWNAKSIIGLFGQELVTPAPKTSNHSLDYYDYLNVVTFEGIRNCKVGQFIVQDGDFLKVIEAKDLKDYKLTYPERKEGCEDKAYIYSSNEGHSECSTETLLSAPEHLWELYTAVRSYSTIDSGTFEFNQEGEITKAIVTFKN